MENKKNSMKKIERATLVAIDCYSYGKTVNALQKSMEQNEFDEVLFLTDIPIEVEGITAITIPTIKSKEEYSYLVIKELYKYIDTDFILLIQWDGYTLNGDLFDERLYEYDYAGALWPEVDGLTNGNGGYSWRSKRLLEAIANDDAIKATNPEDAQICRTYRNYLETHYGLKWATEEICERFSFELKEPNQLTMGFHGNFHAPFKPTIILKRDAAGGDILMVEPIMRYFYEKGYNIVLDTLPQFYDLFQGHYFPIKHISQFDRGRIKPEKEIDLTLAYEVKPRQNYIKSYFEFCGIKDYKLTRPILFPFVNEATKMFKKYAIIHIDVRETKHRNIYFIDWGKVKKHLEALGYFVLQVGLNDHEKCGEEINTPTIAYLKFIIGGCDLFIGVDSLPAQIAHAYRKKSIVFFGSVNPDYIYTDLDNTVVIQANCDKAFCWHTNGSTGGNECHYRGTDKYLQCCYSEWEEVVDGINMLHKNTTN